MAERWLVEIFRTAREEDAGPEKWSRERVRPPLRAPSDMTSLTRTRENKYAPGLCVCVCIFFEERTRAMMRRLFSLRPISSRLAIVAHVLRARFEYHGTSRVFT